jgi:hypothetical protein
MSKFLAGDDVFAVMEQRRSRPVRRGLRARVVSGLLCVLVLVPASCGVPAPDTDWDPAVARTVARRVQAAYPEAGVRVLGTVGSAGGTELPWSVRQALATAGIEVAASPGAEHSDAVLLVFERSAREGAEWRVDVRLENAAAGPPGSTSRPAAAAVTWRVRCVGGACEVVDSVLLVR